MNKKNTNHRPVAGSAQVEMMEGTTRTTLCYNNELMMCHFHMRKGARIPLHDHVAVQNGYVLRGAVRFFTANGQDFVARAGDGYLFDSKEAHGSEAMEDSELIESFSPMRPEYSDRVSGAGSQT